MDHAYNPVSRGRVMAVAAWTILVTAAVLGIVSEQTSQLISRHFQFGERAIITAAVAVESAARPLPKHQVFPMVLTIPFAVTRTQQIMVARLKQREELANRVESARGRLKGAPGLLAGLALISASQSSNR